MEQWGPVKDGAGVWLERNGGRSVERVVIHAGSGCVVRWGGPEKATAGELPAAFARLARIARCLYPAFPCGMPTRPFVNRRGQTEAAECEPAAGQQPCDGFHIALTQSQSFLD